MDKKIGDSDFSLEFQTEKRYYCLSAIYMIAPNMDNDSINKICEESVKAVTRYGSSLEAVHEDADSICRRLITRALRKAYEWKSKNKSTN